MIRIDDNLRFTSFFILIAVNGSIDLVLVVANIFFDAVDLIQHSSTSSSNKRQKANTMKKNLFFYVINNRASNVFIKNVYEAENVNHDTKKICTCQIMHDKLCICKKIMILITTHVQHITLNADIN